MITNVHDARGNGSKEKIPKVKSLSRVDEKECRRD